MLRRIQQTGHKPIVLMGGGTTKIGDPTDKDKTRPLFIQTIIVKNLVQQFDSGHFFYLGEDIAISTRMEELLKAFPACSSLVGRAADQAGLAMVEQISHHSKLVVSGFERKPWLLIHRVAHLVNKAPLRTHDTTPRFSANIGQESPDGIGR